jgi:hypothetical protein
MYSTAAPKHGKVKEGEYRAISQLEPDDVSDDLSISTKSKE